VRGLRDPATTVAIVPFLWFEPSSSAPLCCLGITVRVRSRDKRAANWLRLAEQLASHATSRDTHAASLPSGLASSSRIEK
jgi:hypothetical protein